MQVGGDNPGDNSSGVITVGRKKGQGRSRMNWAFDVIKWGRACFPALGGQVDSGDRAQIEGAWGNLRTSV